MTNLISALAALGLAGVLATGALGTRGGGARTDRQVCLDRCREDPARCTERCRQDGQPDTCAFACKVRGDNCEARCGE